MNAAPLGWSGIVRLGLVQTALGAIVVLMTSTINRVMVVELALPALVPGAARRLALRDPDSAARLGLWRRCRRTTHALDRRRHRGACRSAASARRSALRSPRQTSASALALAAVAFLLVGVGAGAAGTSVLAMLATRVAPQRRAAAATTVWVMMILGFAITRRSPGISSIPFSNAAPDRRDRDCVCAVALSSRRSPSLGVEGRRAPSAGVAAQNGRFPCGLHAGVARAGGAPVHDLHLRLDARLQHAGTARRALRRRRLRHDARRRRRSSPACSTAACCSA